jgi:hypothetical protein
MACQGRGLLVCTCRTAGYADRENQQRREPNGHGYMTTFSRVNGDGRFLHGPPGWLATTATIEVLSDYTEAMNRYAFMLIE